MKTWVKRQQGRVSKRAVIVVLVAIIVVAAIGSGIWYFADQNRKIKQQAASDAPLDEPNVTKSQSKIDTITNAYESGSGLDETQKKLQEGEAVASSTSEKVDYALKSVELYNQAGKGSEAMSRAVAAEAKYKTAETAAVLAAQYEQSGNYAKAAEYYQLAAERSPKSDKPTERSQYNDYLIEKREMEAKL